MQLKLPFQRRIFQDLLNEQDGLVITSPGLGITSILTEFIHLYATKKYATIQENSEGVNEVHHISGLVFLVNADWDIIDPYLAGRTRLIKVNNATLANERQEIYRRGGIIAITSRILVVDLLCNRVPIPLVTGFLVADAHQVSPNSTEAFILRIFRLQNKSGFIKAFSDRPDLFMAGFAPLERTLKLLYLRTTHLWPRFQVDVAENLDSTPIHVVEIHQPLTKKMQLIQASIMDCLSDCLTELRRSKLLMEVEEDLTLENALGRNFDRMLRTQLESVWHRLGFRTREVISDVATLRQLLTYLTSYDCVSFLKYMDTIIALNSVKASGFNPLVQAQPSAWLMTDSANTLIKAARARVFAKDADKISPVLEEQPKWALVAQLIDEIRETDENAKVLISTLNPRACRQIRNYLSGQKAPGEPHPLLKALYQNYWRTQQEGVQIKIAPTPQPLARRPPPSKRRRVRGGGQAGSDAAGHQTTLSGWAANDETVIVEEVPCEALADEEKEVATFDPAQFTQYFGLIRAPELLVHSITGDLDDLLLSSFAPSHVIMVDPDPAMVRRIEAYQASTSNKVTVYFLVYSDSVEEQRFLAGVRREKDGFERLINEKAKLVIPVDHGLLRPSLNLDSRTAGGQICQPVKVVIDVREFRAALPSALHAAGLEVVPVTLQIGDYILTPDLCVERKSIPDLIQSINSGRLYSQCEAMFQFYSTPILLIEFDENKTFSLEAMGDQWSEFVLAEIPRKLVLLSLAFPRLKIIWSSSPAQSAQLFLDLKVFSLNSFSHSRVVSKSLM
ncbi:DNA repair protein RAD16, variant 5 [Entomophthora muscae]|uniref:DNA repair protein RAD16, variant 5 n=1 Tax=Entomophthora muscae TaxID=34485 RepID=A0ACC2RQ01_9FUNG|nr:DNA repair protein RAD16, variant 5 [Entomophthora muscae]